MIRYHNAVFALAMTVFLGCSTVQVSQDYKETTDFSAITTFAWASAVQEKTGDVRVDSPLMDARIRAAVEMGLAGKGLRDASTGDVDVQVLYQYQIRQQIHSTGTRGSVGVGYGTGGSGGGVMLGTGADVRSYDEGLLIIDLIRPSDGTLLWRGNATFIVPEHPTPEASTALINEAVDKTLAQFPPKTN
ncbi:MAG: DUF4136 domain-containing protein [Pseudomonadota bacterium]